MHTPSPNANRTMHPAHNCSLVPAFCTIKQARPTTIKERPSIPFSQRQSTRNQRALWLYSDGSKLQDGRTGAGWVAFYAGRQIFIGHAGLGPHLEVYDAEAEALCRGLSAAISHSLATQMESLYACLDNQAVAMGIYQHPKGTRANTLQKCIKYLKYGTIALVRR